MEKSFPFNAKYSGASFDRVYSADDWAAERAAYISNGILTQAALAVTPAGGMNISVAPGNASINGRTYFNTAVLTKTLDSSSATRRRIDLVVLRLDTEAREMYVAVKSSEFAISPVVPEVTVSDTVTELPLAQVAIGLDATEITAEDVTDLRPMAKYPLNYDQVYESYVAELKERLGIDQISDLGVFAKLLTDAGAGNMALFDDGTYKEVPRIVTGSYHLSEDEDGVVNVTLGFQPKAVYCCRQAHPTAAYENGEMYIYGGLAVPGISACRRYDSSTAEYVYIVAINETGFQVMTDRDNSSGYKYMGSVNEYGGKSGGNSEYVLCYMAVV